ncbi:MAG TPA: helix-turn-helix domain-containing protein [Solirubrobacteraceae bacterium]|jgi:transcriptional regulator with XRE-family HTH domain|nr:helix-turn-helix domain-containing protein [Solirubrobacteraceae bacterium]
MSPGKERLIADARAALGRALRQAREEKGMSVDELAQGSGIARHRIEAIEAGEPDPEGGELSTGLPRPELVALGRVIRKRRKQKGMSVAELAEAADFERRDLVKIEAGELDPGFDGLVVLADGLGVPLEAIVPPDDGEAA